MGVDGLCHLPQVSLLGFLAGLDDGLEPLSAAVLASKELADGEAEKVEAHSTFVLVERVGDAGLAGFQVQAH